MQDKDFIIEVDAVKIIDWLQSRHKLTKDWTNGYRGA